MQVDVYLTFNQVSINNKRYLLLFFLKKKQSVSLNQNLNNISIIKKMKTKYSSVILNSNKKYDEFSKFQTKNSLQYVSFKILFKFFLS